MRVKPQVVDPRAEVEAHRLSAIPIFANLEESQRAAIATRFVTERYPRGKRILEEGDPGDKLYIIVCGAVEVRKSSPASRLS